MGLARVLCKQKTVSDPATSFWSSPQFPILAAPPAPAGRPKGSSFGGEFASDNVRRERKNTYWQAFFPARLQARELVHALFTIKTLTLLPQLQILAPSYEASLGVFLRNVSTSWASATTGALGAALDILTAGNAG